jgi:hypothetical protein
MSEAVVLMMKHLQDKRDIGNSTGTQRPEGSVLVDREYVKTVERRKKEMMEAREAQEYSNEDLNAQRMVQSNWRLKSRQRMLVARPMGRGKEVRGRRKPCLGH